MDWLFLFQCVKIVLNKKIRGLIMNKDNRLKVLKPFLQDYFTKDLEEKLNLEETKGIPNCNFRYDSSMWKSEDDF